MHTVKERIPDPLSEFKEGQWWVVELDLAAKTGTPNFKRAVAVVHHMLRSAAVICDSKNT